MVFEAIRALMTEDEKPKRKIGFKACEKKIKYRSKKKLKISMVSPDLQILLIKGESHDD